MLVNLNSHRTLQQAHRNNKAVGLLKTEQNSFDPLQGTAFNTDPLANLEERPGLGLKAGIYDRLKGRNFTLDDWERCLSHPYDQKHPRGDQDGQTLLQIKPAKDVTWEKGTLYDFHPV